MGGVQVRLGERGCRKRVQEGLQRRIIYAAECSEQVASANSSWTLGPLAPLTVIGELNACDPNSVPPQRASEPTT